MFLQNENINSPAATATTQSSQKKFVRHGTITEGEKTPTANGGSVSIFELMNLMFVQLLTPNTISVQTSKMKTSTIKPSYKSSKIKTTTKCFEVQNIALP